MRRHIHSSDEKQDQERTTQIEKSTKVEEREKLREKLDGEEWIAPLRTASVSAPRARRRERREKN